MVGVKMSEKKRIDFVSGRSSLVQANHGAAPTIEQQFLTARLDEDSRAKSPSIRKLCAGTEKRYRDDHVWGAGYPHVGKHKYAKPDGK
jgi:hypothetical protein